MEKKDKFQWQICMITQSVTTKFQVPLY